MQLDLSYEERKLLEYIRQEIDVYDVMMRLGEWDGPKVTKQVKCDFHGKDTKPSARVYADSGIMWCFACANHRYDAVRYTMSHEGIGMREALWKIQKWFDIEVKKEEKTFLDDINSILEGKAKTEKDPLDVVEKRMVEMKGKLPFDKFMQATCLLEDIYKVS